VTAPANPPTTQSSAPRRRWASVTAAALTGVVVLGVAGAIAITRSSTTNAAAPATSAAASPAVSNSSAECPTATGDPTPVAPAPTRQPTGPTVVQFPHSTEPARRHLQALIEHVSAAPNDSTACGRYAYLHVRQWAADTTIGPDGLGTTQTIEFDYRRWRAEDGSGRVITMRDEPAADPATTTEDFPAGGLPGPLSAPVNTDPGLLASQINDIQPWANGDQAGIRATAEIYGWHTPNRDQRATILAVLRDSELIWRGNAIDRVGRPGVAVSFDSDNGVSRNLLILDPATGEPLAFELVTLRNPGSSQDRSRPYRTTNSSSTTIANVNSPDVVRLDREPVRPIRCVAGGATPGGKPCED
jgi:hypothetical protein